MASDWSLDRPFIIYSMPANGWLDRLEYLDGLIPFSPPLMDVKTVRIKFDKAVRNINDELPLDTGSFEVTVTGGGSRSVVQVSNLGNNEYDVTLNAPLPPGQWTMIRALVEDTGNRAMRSNPLDRLDLGFLPGDCDGNRTTNTTDLEVLIDVVSGQGGQPNIYFHDINRDGIINNQDVARERQLLNGTNSTQAWEDYSLPARP